jgi:PAS domain S-box-containing protein
MPGTTHQNPWLEVLLAEDNGGDVCLIERALRQAVVPCRVHVLDNGVRALAFLRHEDSYGDAPRPDLVILDLNLPRKSGLEVLREMKRDRELRSIPVVVLSSSRAEMDVAHAYEAQATAYFVKPLSDYRNLVELIIRFVSAAEHPANSVAARRGSDRPNDAMAQGVTERKRNEETFRIAFEAAPIATLMVDQHGTILLVNTTAERLFGYERAEMEGHSIDMLLPARYRAAHSQYREAIVRRPEARAMGADGELLALRRDGSEVPIEIGFNPIMTEEGLVVLSSIVDISERKSGQTVLFERTKELLRSNAELEQFAYVASHDLQEPLRMVASYTRLLAEEYADKLDAEGQRFVHFARDGAERMQQLIHDLLAYSRVGSRTRKSRQISSQTCLQSALANLGISIGETGTVVRAIGLPSVTADPVQVAELFQNLISNAIKFRREPAPLIDISAEAAADGYKFSVRDNGIGIEPQYFEEVFQVFKRLHSKEEYPGTGIGLAICKRIVERSGGRIWVESQPGMGSTFCFTLPANPPST